jgi:hypothetical protein
MVSQRAEGGGSAALSLAPDAHDRLTCTSMELDAGKPKQI